MEEIKGTVIRKRRRGFFAILVVLALVFGALTVNAGSKPVGGLNVDDNLFVEDGDVISIQAAEVLNVKYVDQDNKQIGEASLAAGGLSKDYTVEAVKGNVGGKDTENEVVAWRVAEKIKVDDTYTVTLKAVNHNYISYWKDDEVIQCWISNELFYPFAGEVPDKENFLYWEGQDGKKYGEGDGLLAFPGTTNKEEWKFVAHYNAKNIDDDEYTLDVGSWKKGSKAPLKAIMDSETVDVYNSFKAGGTVKIDNKLLSEGSDYKYSKGSLIVSIQPSYLEQLKAKPHKLTIQLSNGDEKSANFTITSKNNNRRYYDDDDDDDDDDTVVVEEQTVSAAKITPKTGERDFLDDLAAFLGLSFR